MKRKVIQHSPTSLVITLPTSWARKNLVKKGDELNLEENKKELLIRKGEIVRKYFEATIDISNLDKTTILQIIRNLYREGYDKINIKFSKERVPYKKIKGAFLVTEIIHREVNRLIGYEITREKQNFCIVESISEGVQEELPKIIRRIHMLLIDITETLYEATKNNDKAVLKTIHEKHETIIRFINYCLRSGAKELDEKHPITDSQYYLLASMDRVVHLLRSSSKRLLKLNGKPSNELVKTIGKTVEALRLFTRFVYQKKPSIVVEMNNLRYSVEKMITKRPTKLEGEQDLVFYHMRHIHHLLLDISNVIGM
ncbi:hypothetical protein HQ533_03985 [Candidatus Woesearchaeota archaeon]|nr:hypothetical protein [Candidatus Woesearchaeota archaeon]